MVRVVINREVGNAAPALTGTWAAGRGAVLDSGVPWLRTGEELEHEWRRLRTVLDSVFAKAVASSDPAAITPGDRHVVGVYAALLWTLGGTTEVPMGGSESPVTGLAIRQQLADAEDLLVSRREGWEAALGIVQWLLWITGGSERAPTYFR